jgi:hypothetical protein
VTPLEVFPPESWLEVKVNGESFPRQRVSSVPYAYQADLMNPRYVLGDSIVEIDIAQEAVLWIGAGCYGKSAYSSKMTALMTLDDDTLWNTVRTMGMGSTVSENLAYSILVPHLVPPGHHIVKLHANVTLYNPYLWVLVSGKGQ